MPENNPHSLAYTCHGSALNKPRSIAATHSSLIIIFEIDRFQVKKANIFGAQISNFAEYVGQWNISVESRSLETHSARFSKEPSQ